MEIELYFVALYKHGNFCFVEVGPFCWQEEADSLAREMNTRQKGACSYKTVKVKLPFEE
jgi:hypothetical protein